VTFSQLLEGGVGKFLRSVLNARAPFDRPAVPYPVSVQSRHVETEPIPSGGGVECFDTREAIELNRARLAHLVSLELPLAGSRVLDVGCGVGHLAAELVNLGFSVVCVDGREENVASLRSRYPSLAAHVADVETGALHLLGRFDVVLCYGLLYHLENPIKALRNIESICGEALLLETMICDHSLPVLRIEDDTLSSNQGLRGIGCRPSPGYLAVALSRVGFRHVYAPRVPPNHPDFQFEWRNNLDSTRDGRNMRCVFVASKKELRNCHLTSLLRS
jgi:SAM-dependent methyltransferase